jgi:hypothetical protein
MPDTRENAKVLTLIVKRVSDRDIRKNTETIRLHSLDSDIGG